MSRTETDSYSVAVTPYTITVEEGVGDSIDSLASAGFDPTGISIYDGNDFENYYRYSELGFSSSQENTITNAVDNVLGDYEIIGLDTSGSFEGLKVNAGSLSFALEFSAGFTLWTDYRGIPYYNHAYRSFSVSYGWEWDIDVDDLIQIAKMLLLVVVLSAIIAILLVTFPVSATASAVVGTALFTIIEKFA